MKSIDTLELEHDYEKAVTKLDHAAPAHADRNIVTSTLIMTPSTEITALFLKGCIDSDLCEDAYHVCKTVDDLIDKRPSAVGTESMPRINKNGRLGTYYVTPDPVMEILERDNVRQGLLGAVGGTSARPAQLSALTRKRPKLLDQLRELIEEVDDIYVKYLPTFYAVQRSEVKKAPKLQLWHTAFSTIYLARNFRTAYHRDSGNLKGAMTALMPMGEFTGGELVLPRWRIAFALQPGDLLLFDPQQLHGNLPFEGERLSAAFYCERRIAGCGK
jgi:hypothetical protein